MSYIGQPFRSDEQVKADLIRDLVATVDVLEIAKDRLIDGDAQETTRLFRAVQGDLNRYEALIRQVYKPTNKD
ncbi:hypothetical protein A6046_03235 [[Haemophilus] ducreyi]|uniref:Uncharacterized protein n=2 Tax=Haemophilus ducreyi TaxID=730 RepID=Q7VPH7_HAEDU|nr:hypothetical protein [[Haemophilus] ducreyi]AAP95104.1 hypothetical protein HD_0101 [[Haemophilus] ducreyi 35000HP]AKO30280.1 hypothetical protein RY60_00385 [[Haemophilus] ducreyi]AKO31713.1 hypothetical protein RZ57_00390 [[Haemophilus] ducreyi]AKO33166.1 hypothetical protein RZ58_00390 [[Haemophilus] ducreyi]AKO34615.1 hypothetical protein RZ59_00385 [[Haemophilus] ducreyi]